MTKISFPIFLHFPILVILSAAFVHCYGSELIGETDIGKIYSVNRCCLHGFQLQNGNCISTKSEENQFSSLSVTNNSITLPFRIFSSFSSSPETEQDFSFRLLQNPPGCHNGSFILSMSLNSTRENQNASFTFNGYLKHKMDYYSPLEYCIISYTEEEINVSVCEPQCDSISPCVRKCCDFGEVWDLSDYKEHDKFTCKSSGAKLWTPTLYSDRYAKLLDSDAGKVRVHYQVDHPRNWCNGSFIILSLKDFSEHRRSPFRILQNGSVVHKYRRRKWENIPYDEICVDGIQNYHEDSRTSEKRLYNGDETDTIIIDCRQYDEEEMFITEPEISTSTLYACTMTVACIFLFLTATVFIVLWKHQNIHGWTILGHVISLFFQYIFLISAHLLREEGLFCDVTAIASHFFFISTFSWLTVINFDVFWTFWKLSPTCGRKSELKRFFFYSLFAVGVPVTIVVIGLSLDYKYGNDPDSEIITPEYGRSRCFLDPEYAQLPYLYGPIGFLLTANFVFFIATLISIHKKLKLANATKFKTENLKQKLRFFAKLFVVVGCTWIFEIVSWASSKENEPIPWYWIMFDLINMLQAVAIFIIFVCNTETLYNLEQKFDCIKKFRNMISSKKEDTITRQGQRNSLHSQATVVENNGFENVELK